MEKSNNNRSGVIGITNLARNINSKIGFYEEHYINEDFGYTVRLSENGAIRLSRTIAQDFEADPNLIIPERIEKVAKTFRNY